VPQRVGSPPYEALSYAWGSLDNLQQVTLRDVSEGHDHTLNDDGEAGLHAEAVSTVSVTQNLAATLRHLRNIDALRILWVDAICIDQKNLEERSQEVRRMGDIYHLASRVVVSLGTSKSCTEMAAEIMEQLGAPSAESIKRCCYNCTFSRKEQVGLMDLMARPWFSRLWIWQEVCKAREAILVCGSKRLRGILSQNQ